MTTRFSKSNGYGMPWASRYEYSVDGGKTWEPSSTARLRSRAGVRAAEALMDGLVEQVTSRDGAVIYRRKKPQEDA